ncbi:hypothetical protein G9A89_011846 [Geosiphon pyriformis]|nr:hypothetical protein G9A89_011846 [Geosiphon pyriformis]
MEAETATPPESTNNQLPPILSPSLPQHQDDTEQLPHQGPSYHAFNYFLEEMHGMLNDADLEKIVENQKNMHENLEQTAVTLTSLNDLSTQKYDELLRKYDLHAKCLKEMKNDLEYIFKKIRLIKTKVASQHPDAFAKMQKKIGIKQDGDDDED